MKISVISPVYKAENIVDELLKRLVEDLSKITQDFEIILVDDNSPDDSWNKILESLKRDSRIKAVKLSRNFGQHNAITCGLDFCTGDWVVVMDCDLQDDPKEIIKLYRKVNEGFDIVLARRSNRKDNFVKRFSNKFFYKIFNYLTDMNCDPGVGVYRIMSKKAVENFRKLREGNRYFYGLIQWMGFSTAMVDVEHGERYEGKSTYNLKKLFNLALETVISYSDKPLKIITIFGLVISVVSFFCGIALLFRALLFGSPVMGWSSLIVSIYLLSGIIIMVLGIIGLYIGKTFTEVKKRPIYLISSLEGLKENGHN